MLNDQFNPPKRAAAILRWSLPIQDRETMLGDFEEFYEELCHEAGCRKARSWYWRQALKSLPHFIRNYFFWRLTMLLNHARLAVRNLNKHRGFSFINIAGLAMGLACCMVILLYVAHVDGFDAYYNGADRMYRILEYRKVPVGEFVTAGISLPVGEILKEGYAEVEAVTRLMPSFNVQVEQGDFKDFENRVLYGEPSCFDMLDWHLVEGDVGEALQNPLGVIVSRRLALKYFGSVNVLGRTLVIKDPLLNPRYLPSPGEVFTVTGVIEDAPSNTHIKADILLPLMMFKDSYLYTEWHSGPARTYVRLRSAEDAGQLGEKIRRLAYDYVGREFKAWQQTREYMLQPMCDVHFQSRVRELPVRGNLEPVSNRQYLLIYAIIAGLVLLIGTMNFINLSNARAVTRIREVGLRKVLGAGRLQLVGQFLGEAIFITAFSALLAVGIARLLLPVFNAFAGTTLALESALQPSILAAICGLVLLVGGFSGLYPAFILSRFTPDQVLRGTHASTRGAFMLRLLVTGQFAISIFLAVAALTVRTQLAYLQGGELGFNLNHKYVVNFRSREEVIGKAELFRDAVSDVPGVISAAVSSGVPGTMPRKNALAKSDSKTAGGPMLSFVSCDDHFFEDYDIAMVAGRPLDAQKNDENSAFIINESAVKYLGYSSPEEAIGQRYHESWFGRWKTIVGVVRDFYFQGLSSELEPMYFELSPARYRMLTVTLNPQEYGRALAGIRETWDSMFPEMPMTGFFLKENFARLYEKESQMGQLLHILTGMGLLTASMGLLGLASFMVRSRIKEIGIRKVLGASLPRLMGLFSRQFAWLVLLANVAALPLSYLLLKRWLENYPNRIVLNWEIFILPAAAAFTMALLPVLLRSLLAARSNPVKSLRYE